MRLIFAKRTRKPIHFSIALSNSKRIKRWIIYIHFHSAVECSSLFLSRVSIPVNIAYQIQNTNVYQVQKICTHFDLVNTNSLQLAIVVSKLQTEIPFCLWEMREMAVNEWKRGKDLNMNLMFPVIVPTDYTIIHWRDCLPGWQIYRLYIVHVVKQFFLTVCSAPFRPDCIGAPT